MPRHLWLRPDPDEDYFSKPRVEITPFRKTTAMEMRELLIVKYVVARRETGIRSCSSCGAFGAFWVNGNPKRYCGESQKSAVEPADTLKIARHTFSVTLP